MYFKAKIRSLFFFPMSLFSLKVCSFIKAFLVQKHRPWLQQETSISINFWSPIIYQFFAVQMFQNLWHNCDKQCLTATAAPSTTWRVQECTVFFTPRITINRPCGALITPCPILRSVHPIKQVLIATLNPCSTCRHEISINKLYLYNNGKG